MRRRCTRPARTSPPPTGSAPRSGLVPIARSSVSRAQARGRGHPRSGVPAPLPRRSSARYCVRLGGVGPEVGILNLSRQCPDPGAQASAAVDLMAPRGPLACRCVVGSPRQVRAAVRAARIEAASAAASRPGPCRAETLISSLGRLARASARAPVRRPRLGEDDAARAMGLAVAATVRMGVRRREGQRSDRPADLCRRRARPRLAGSIERVRRAGVSGRLDRGDGRPAPGGGPRDDGRGRRPGPRRPASARQPGLPRRHRGADATRPGGVADGPLGARPARRSRWERCGRGAWRWRSGRTISAWTRPRRASC